MEPWCWKKQLLVTKSLSPLCHLWWFVDVLQRWSIYIYMYNLFSPLTFLLLEVLFMKSHLFLCTIFTHSMIFSNTFCSIILLLVIAHYIKLQCQFSSGITITYKAEWYWRKADNQSHRLARWGSSGGQHLIHPTTNDLTFSVYIHSRYLMLDWKNHTQKCSEITRVSGIRLSKRNTASGISLQQEIKFISVSEKFQLQD